jgi:predicted metal-binding membrane protein
MPQRGARTLRARGGELDQALGPFLGTWTVMMAAMMLPSATPMILLHRLGADGRLRTQLWSAAFVAGYLIVWASVGIIVWGTAMAATAITTPEQRAVAVAALLLLAGAYQFTPLKSTCLRACRTPADFLLTHWHRGLAGQLQLGIEHGLYCLGCCWALMALFVGVGAMSLVWAVGIALVVVVEKLRPEGVAFGRIAGALLIAASLIVLARPDLAISIGGPM